MEGITNNKKFCSWKASVPVEAGQEGNMKSTGFNREVLLTSLAIIMADVAF